MGLGSVKLTDRDDGLTLEEARDRALELRRLVKRGIDPLAQKQAERAANQGRLPEGERRIPTFEEVAEKVIEQRTAKMTNRKAKAQWTNTLKTYAYPALGGLPVDRITPSDVRGVLEPIWDKVPETASRVRQRIRNVLDYAADHDWIAEEALAKITRSIGKLEKLKSEDDEGHPAMAVADVPAFVTKLEKTDGMGAKALRFLLLTAARSGQVRGATWDEIDLDNAVWVTPKDRMKKKHSDHRVPLSAPAVALLKSLRRESSSNLVFPSPTKPGKQMSDGTLAKTMRDAGVTDAVPHGLRATFSTWAANSGFDTQLIEAALHHKDENKVRAAYQRTDFYERRVPMMEAWGALETAAPTGDKVVPIKAKK
jgi:integrase